MASKGKRSFYCKYVKRSIDILFSLIAIIILSPILLVTWILVRIFLGSPVLFTPTRPGMNERIFRLYKFRSMKNTKNSEGKLLSEKDRLTKLGKFLRMSSLDELPELFNILLGDMSIVGPRPLSKGYLVSYTDRQRERHSVRPGLTGLAQISGRNNLPWDERIEKDLEYVRNVSFLQDCSIVFRTLIKVLKRADVTVPGGKKLDLAAHNLIAEEGENVRMSGDTTWPEIGSHFWLEDVNTAGGPGEGLRDTDGDDHTLTFSGRAAINLAVRDAVATRGIKKAYVPSYCCLSMIQAFIDLEIPYEFYEVGFDGKDITFAVDERKKNVLFLTMRYFGAGVKDYDAIIRRMKQNGCVIIEDITHVLFDAQQKNPDVDYRVASIRKWLPVPAGGYLSKTVGTIADKPSIESGHAVEKKLLAMQEKRTYITGQGGDKAEFLKNYSSFEQDLIQLDPLLKIDPCSEEILSKYDIADMKKRRKTNAGVLYGRLAGIHGLTFLNTAFDADTQTPLFVPVLLPEEKRNALRQYLIDNGVYCPVHWPEVVGADPGIRLNELSLICDQRYSEKDMNAVADLIVDWCGKNLS